MTTAEVSWTPLESNPDVMNKFIWNLGVPSKWNVVDVISLSSDMLDFIPRPVLALILLYPTSEKLDKIQQKEDAIIKEAGQKVSDKVYYMRQYIHNACGTIALIHSIANCLDKIELKDGPLKEFLESSQSMSPEDRGTTLMKNAQIAEEHKKIASEGQTEAPPAENEVIHHFVSFVNKDGDLYELDGSRPFAINHGPTSPEKFVQDAAKVMLGVMAKDPEEVRFTVCALTGSQ